MKLLAHLAVVVLCFVLLACGTPGAPRAPSLDLPRPVDDLTATRKGDKITLTWTPSRQNTDGTLVRRTGFMRVCRGVNDFPMTACEQTVADVSTPANAPNPKQPEQKAAFTDTLASNVQQQFPTGFATYAVAMLNRRGRTAGLSNQVRVPLAPTASAPTDLKAEITPEGVRISAYGKQDASTCNLPVEHHLFRRVENSTAEIDLGAMLDFMSGPSHYLQILDRSVEWDKTYSYHVAAITTTTLVGVKVQVAGDDSPTLIVKVEDTFPPAQPVGVQAVFSGVGQQPFIDLTWASNQEPDLAGYNVYRREQGQDWVRINRDLVKAPAFRDTEVLPGHTYVYSVSAVDLRNNESPKSEPTSEAVPRP